MIEPIVLDEFGTNLLVDQAWRVQETDVLGLSGLQGSRIGYHNCGKDFFIYKHSDTHNVIVCEKCAFRLVIPKEVKTYGQLRDWRQVNILHPGLPEQVRMAIFAAAERVKTLDDSQLSEDGMANEIWICEVTSDERLRETLRAFSRRKKPKLVKKQE